MLASRRAMIEEVNRKFGTDIRVDFSGAWRAEVTRYEDISGEAEIDGTENEEKIEEEEATNDPEENEATQDTGRSDDSDESV